MHSRIDGPAAYDVLTNFEDRWMKAAKPKGLRKLKTSYDDALLRIDRIPDIIGVFDALSISEDDPEAWHVQVIRPSLGSSDHTLRCDLFEGVVLVLDLNIVLLQ